MWLQATLSRDDLATYLGDILPVRLSLDGEEPPRVFELGVPRRLELVPGVGLRVETYARIQWPVLGIQVPANVRSVQVLLKPTIEEVERTENEVAKEPVLTFGLELEHLDVSLLPGVVEGAIVEVVNAELAKKNALPMWRFTRTLDFRFAAPTTLGLEGQIRLFATWAELKITDDGLTLAMSFRGAVTREDTFELEDPESIPPPAPVRMRTRPHP